MVHAVQACISGVCMYVIMPPAGLHACCIYSTATTPCLCYFLFSARAASPRACRPRCATQLYSASAAQSCCQDATPPLNQLAFMCVTLEACISPTWLLLVASRNVQSCNPRCSLIPSLPPAYTHTVVPCIITTPHRHACVLQRATTRCATTTCTSTAAVACLRHSMQL